MLTREDFAKRYAEQVPISIHEILYPLLQGWDSVCIDADVEMGGSDQLFNNMVGRQFQQEQKPEDKLAGQCVIVTPLLVGLDGHIKMSKSKGNYIGITDAPNDMFGKIMSLPDTLMESYYTLLTDLPETEFKPLISSSPRDAKVKLAKYVIAWLHSPTAADAAEAAFVKQFVKKDVPDEMPEFNVGPGPHKIGPLLVAAKLAASNGEAIRKVKEGAVYLNGEKVTDFQKEITLSGTAVIKLGRKYARLLA
jgi:tyrosyl-tRNA synthetase